MQDARPGEAESRRTRWSATRSRPLSGCGRIGCRPSPAAQRDATPAAPDAPTRPTLRDCIAGVGRIPWSGQ